MTITAVVVPADEQKPVRQVEIERSDLDAYRQLVGGNIEVLNLSSPRASLYFNEEGKLNELPLNRRATAILWVHNPAFHGHDSIVGDAFIVGPPDSSGNDTTTPAELLNLFFHTERYRVEVQAHDEETIRLLFSTKRHRFEMKANEPTWLMNQKTYDNWYAAYVYAVAVADWWKQVDGVRIVDAD